MVLCSLLCLVKRLFENYGSMIIYENQLSSACNNLNKTKFKIQPNSKTTKSNPPTVID